MARFETAEDMETFTHCGYLLPQQAYTYRLEIENSIGYTASTTQTFQTTAGTLPAPPQLALLQTRMSSARISVTPPCDNGGAPSLSYYVEQRTASDGRVELADYFPCCELELSGLQPVQDYLIGVRAESSVGKGEWTNLTFSTPSGIPSAPSTTLLYASTTQLEVAINPPTAINTSSLSIEIIATRASTSETMYQNALICTSSDASYMCPETFVIHGLDAIANNNLFDIAVRGVADGGVSAWSTSAYTTDVGAPGTLGFKQVTYTVAEGAYASVDIARSYGTTVEENVTFEIVDTISLSSDGWGCTQQSYGGACSSSPEGSNSGNKFPLLLLFLAPARLT